jgi:hypothetical protein
MHLCQLVFSQSFSLALFSILNFSGQERLHPSVSSSRDFPFRAINSLFSTTTSSNAPLGGDKDFDQKIRSFSNAFISRRVQKKSSKPRQIATRHRLVSQAIGLKGVQKVVSLVKEIKQILAEYKACDAYSPSEKESLPQPVRDLLFNTVLVDAWGSSPIDALKTLPWEEMMEKAQQNAEAYRAWQSTK